MGRTIRVNCAAGQQAMAERIIAEELVQPGWKEEDLANRRKTDSEKLAFACRLRR
jgi:hypothetical protein